MSKNRILNILIGLTMAAIGLTSTNAMAQSQFVMKPMKLTHTSMETGIFRNISQSTCGGRAMATTLTKDLGWLFGKYYYTVLLIEPTMGNNRCSKVSVGLAKVEKGFDQVFEARSNTWFGRPEYDYVKIWDQKQNRWITKQLYIIYLDNYSQLQGPYAVGTKEIYKWNVTWYGNQEANTQVFEIDLPAGENKINPSSAIGSPMKPMKSSSSGSGQTTGGSGWGEVPEEPAPKTGGGW